MISLCGLTLSTGRYEDAADILAAFSNTNQIWACCPICSPTRMEIRLQTPSMPHCGFLKLFTGMFEKTGDMELVRSRLYDPMRQDIRGLPAGNAA